MATPQDGARVTLPDVLRAHPGPLKVDSSGEHHGACPMPDCDADTDGWWAAERAGRLIIQCRKCNATFADQLSALGLRTNGAGLQLHIPPVFGSRREGAPAASGTRCWSCTGPDGGRVHVRTDGPDGKRIRWDGAAGPGPKRMLYVVPLPPGAPPGLPLVVTEGEPDADAAAALYGDGVQVVGTVCGAGVQPDRDVWESLGVSGRRVLLWPDNDVAGAEHMQRIGAAVLELGAAAVLTVDPLRLGLTGKGDGAADWQPPAGADVRAILHECSNDARASALMPAAEWIRIHNAPPDAELAPDAPGLLYRGRAVLLHQKRGGGKSTYAAFVAAVASRGGLRVALMVDDDTRTWALRLTGFRANLDNVKIGGMVDVLTAGLVATLGAADVVIVDSWRRWARAAGVRGAGATNDESAVGPVIDDLVDLSHAHGVAVLMLANQPKYTDTARGSFSLEDSPDAVRTIERAGNVATIRTPEKSRVGMPKGPWSMRLADDGTGYRSEGDSVPGNGNPMDTAIVRFLQRVGTASGAEVSRNVSGRKTTVLARLAALAEQGDRNLWKLTGAGAAGAAPVPDPPPSTRKTGTGADSGPSAPVPVPVPDPVPIDRNRRNRSTSAPVPVPVPDPVPAVFMGTGGTGADSAVPDPVPVRVPGTGDRPVCTACRRRPSARGMNTCSPCVRMLRVWPELRGKDYINAAVLQEIMGPEWTVKAAG